MKCIFCNGEMEQKNVPYSIDRKGYHLYIRAISGYICSQCGEKMFDEHEVEEIQIIIKTLEQHIDKLKAA